MNITNGIRGGCIAVAMARSFDDPEVQDKLHALLTELVRTSGSQGEAARLLNTSQPQVSLWLKRDRNIPANVVPALATATRTSVDELVDVPRIRAPTSPLPRIADTPNIDTHVARARLIKPEWPDEVWQDLLNSHPRGPVDEEVLPGMLVLLGEADMMFRPTATARPKTGQQPPAKAGGAKGK